MSEAIPSVVIIDDETDLADLLVEAFEDQGFSATSYASGNDFLDKFPAGRLPSVMIVDDRMPGLSGPESLQKACKNQSPSPICYLMTGDMQFEEMGGDASLARQIFYKPFDPYELVEAIQRDLDARKLVRSS